MGTIAVLAPFPPQVFEERFPGHRIVVATGEGDVAAMVAGATVCVADFRHRVRVTNAVAEALAPTCGLVQVPAAGLDSVDVAACERHGIPVASCAGLNAVAVAEWCVFAAIDALRGLSAADRAMRAGRFDQFSQTRFELAGRTVGIVGLGDVGTAAAERFRGFGVELVYWTRNRRPPPVERHLGVRWLELDELVAAADVLVLAVALTPDTRRLLDRARIERLRPTAVVVNAARGEVVDEDALAEALSQYRLHGAAVDTYGVEPPPADHPLLRAERAVLNPHIAGVTAESVGRITQRVFDNVTAALAGGPVQGLVTGQPQAR